jgi:hypothetical protein
VRLRDPLCDEQGQGQEGVGGEFLARSGQGMIRLAQRVYLHGRGFKRGPRFTRDALLAYTSRWLASCCGLFRCS